MKLFLILYVKGGNVGNFWKFSTINGNYWFFLEKSSYLYKLKKIIKNVVNHWN